MLANIITTHHKQHRKSVANDIRNKIRDIDIATPSVDTKELFNKLSDILYQQSKTTEIVASPTHSPPHSHTDRAERIRQHRDEFLTKMAGLKA
jgi:L-ribulose-5-phosphate 3-epimerase UlaE